MKKFLMMAALLITTLTVSAQDYNWAIGVRGGGANSGLTVKNNMGSNAWEATADWGYGDYLRLQGLYLWQQPVITDGFNFYYGAGAYVGSWASKVGVGVEAVVGLEYKIPSLPIAFSVDYRPNIGVLPNFGFGYSDIGLGIKFCF